MFTSNAGMKEIIEQGLPYSESSIWRLQCNAYEKGGPRAWQLTNNPYIARCYAWQTAAAMRDWEAELDPTEPLYILEIGAGAGRFSYLFVQELRRILTINQPICLIISDNVNLYREFWENHPKFKPLIEEGILDFAIFDPTTSQTCHLIKKELTLNNLKNPLIAIANYFYASLPNDIFFYHEGSLYEGYPILSGNNIDLELLKKNPLKMKELDIAFKPVPVVDSPRYPSDPGFDHVLETYRETLEEETSFLLPVDGLRTIRNLKALSSNRMLLLSGDKGVHSRDDLELHSDHRPIFADCGDASVAVNAHAMKRYTEFLGGSLINYPHPPQTDYENLYFNHWLVFFNKPGMQSQDFFNSLFVNGYSPADCYKIIQRALSGQDIFNISQILTLFQLSHYDPELLYFYKALNFQELFAALQETTNHVHYEVMKRVEEHFFWVNRRDDEIGYLLAQAFYYMKKFAHSRKVLSMLIELSGDSAQFRYFLGLCYKEEGNLSKAKQEFERVLKLDPLHPYAEKFLT